MRSDFQFASLLGSVYRNGNLEYTKDGKTLLSPVGNRVSVFDLVNNSCFTFAYQHRKSVQRIALNPQNTLLLSIDTDGRAILVNFRSRVVLHHFNFAAKDIQDVKFSPDGKFFAVATTRFLQLWRISASDIEEEENPEVVNYNDRQFAPFTKFRKLAGHFNDILSISWSRDSRFLLTTSKDMTTRIWSLHSKESQAKMSLAGHRDYVVNAFFNNKQDIIYTLSKDGALLQWEYTKKAVQNDEDSDSEEEEEEDEAQELTKLSWRITKRNYFYAPDHSFVKSSTFHPGSNMLIVGFSNGEFRLYELPSFTLIQQLSIGQNAINTVTVNSTGEWLAFGAAKLGQLLVYEWQSESYILKQQGHFDSMNCVCYSADGSRAITGSDDGKIKVWDLKSGFCLATFSEHRAAVTGVELSSKNAVLFSSSLDGTVRAWDLLRYRNFRTFVAPESRVQFTSVTIDPSGEVVVATALGSDEVFVWSVQTGQLLDSLTGHEAPVIQVSFGKERPVLASASWDKTVRVWDIFGRSQTSEPFQVYSDVVALAMRPDCKQLAVSTLDGQISIWDIEAGKQIGNIDAKKDILVGRYLGDSFTAQNSKRARFFSTIAYSFDGSALICAGKNNSICLYDVDNEVMLRRFKVSENMALDGTLVKLNSSRFTEDGVNLDLVDDAGENSDLEDRIDNTLPGSQRGGDPSLRNVRPEVRVTSLKFSPAATEFVAASTEGLLLYSIDTRTIFDPLDLDMDITPESITEALANEDYLAALVMSLRLNEDYLLAKSFEAVPLNDIPLVVRDVPVVHLPRLVQFVGEWASNGVHLEFALLWLKSILENHGKHIRENKMKYGSGLRLVQRFIGRVAKEVVRVAKDNEYLYDFLSSSKSTEVDEDVNMDNADINIDDVLVKVNDDKDDDVVEDAGESDDDEENEWLGPSDVVKTSGVTSFGDASDEDEE
ncbi:snoRNA-binding rRNA-processing protein [Saccharomycopsis crataegensis]|uniref:SnoRNA-binding rRNA-processing protein n=1 Tax=Saccharomycopsis crataegensis TaxID=43959 RepID=A0AAV5QLU7_9ASCO|nr:snoRNA-binding rRNA-processing protein [Saccharomycopsis crataegensis]